MKIRLLWVGKTKERWLQEGIDKYKDLLGHMAQVEVVQIKGERAASSGGKKGSVSPGGQGEKLSASVGKESDRILKQAQSGYVLLDEHAPGLDSRGLASLLRDRTHIEFVIGGPFGVSDKVKAQAASSISLSPMTFTHEMARVVLLEQLYRAMMIMKGRSYHY